MKVKKSDIILIATVLLIIVIGIFSTKGSNALEDIEYPVTLNGEPGLQQITYNEYETLVANDETFLVIIERESCGYCQMYLPILKEVAEEENIPILYIDTDSITDEEFSLLSSKNPYLKRNNWGTPTTLLMKGNRVLDSIGGYVEKDEVLKFLNDKISVGD